MPIIKSLSRRTKSFKQLIKYLQQHQENEPLDIGYYHNIFTDLNDTNPHDLAELFEKNSEFRSNKQSLYCFHEILSFHINKKNKEYFLQNTHALSDISQYYLSKRAPDAMAYMKTHWEKDHVHCHIIISSNNYMSDETVRLSRSEFKDVKVDLEKYIQSNFPEIQDSYIDHDIRNRYLSKTESSISSIKDSLNLQIYPFFKTLSFTDAINELSDNGFQVYTYRGVPNGIIHEGKKYRYTTLFKNDESLIREIKSEQRDMKKMDDQSKGLEF